MEILNVLISKCQPRNVDIRPEQIDNFRVVERQVDDDIRNTGELTLKIVFSYGRGSFSNEAA